MNIEDREEQARFALADDYRDMMAALRTRERQDRWAASRGHTWDRLGHFLQGVNQPAVRNET